MDRQATQFTGPEGQEHMPYLLTPGPLTTSPGVKRAMLADWGSRDIEFRELVSGIRQDLLRLASCGPSYESVIMQGSGTFAIEAALGSFCPARNGKTLVIANGAYGERAVKILERLNRPVLKLEKSDSEPPSAAEVRMVLDKNSDVTHVWVVHCETTSGIVNPVSDIAAVAKAKGAVFMVDAMSSFGAIPIDMEKDNMDVMVSSSNKCIEGVPGFSYVLVKRDLLEKSRGNSHSIVLDLYDQWQSLEKTGQFRFTPPTHALVAFSQALKELKEEGGVSARERRYENNARTLISGMRALGFKTLLDDREAGPIIQTFLTPRDPNFDFEQFYQLLRKKGFAIYPGKLTKRPSFRIGTIGRLEPKILSAAVETIRQVLAEMNVKDLSPIEA